MLKTREAFALKSDPKTLSMEQRLGWLMLGAYAVFSLIWAFAADAPWDDDCPTRFLNTRNAFHDPVNFISVWNRPLFVLIFSLPSQLGNICVPLLMTLISSVGAWLLWRAVTTLKVPNAWFVVVLYAFQPFFFGTSRVALTEPLAATLICAGFYFLVHRKWWAYALMGGLLPLARLEMSLVLVIWLLPLIQEKQWKSLIWMVLPFFLWNVAAGVIVGDFNYVYNQTFGLDKGVNRYGQTTFVHYFERYFYVLGPVVSLLLVWGLVLRIKNNAAITWIDVQYALGFMLYVVFSWKMSMGNAAGFLRNLVPLSPLAALIALDGFNQAMRAISGVNYAKHPSERTVDRWTVGLTSVACLVITAMFFNKRLALHQILEPLPDYSLLGAMLAVVLLGAVLYVLERPHFRKTGSDVGFSRKVAIGFVCVAVGYTLYKEPPTASSNTERSAVGTIAKFYKHSELSERPTYVNHNWFFWAADINAFDPQYKRVKVENLIQAPLGSVVVWEPHYSSRLGGDVSDAFFPTHPEFVELLRIGHPSRRECVILFEKIGPDSLQQEARSSSFSKANPRFLPAIAARADFLMERRRYVEAIDRYDFGLAGAQKDPDLWYGRGFCMLELGNFGEAVNNLTNAVNLWQKFPDAWLALGIALNYSGDPKSAVRAFNRSIEQNPYNPDSYFRRAGARARMNDLNGAVADYSQAIKMNPGDWAAYRDRAAAYSLQKKLDLARADIAKAVAFMPNDAQVIFVQGRIEMQAENMALACEFFQRSVALGLIQAKEFVAKHCDGKSESSNPPGPTAK